MTHEQLLAIVDCPRTFLGRGYKIHVRIAAKKERMEFWRQQAESATAALRLGGELSAGGYKQSLIENAVVGMISMEEEIAAEIEDLMQTERDIRQAINELVTDTRHKTLLEMRYLDQIRMEEIATQMRYSFRWVQRLHKKTLKELKQAALSALKT